MTEITHRSRGVRKIRRACTHTPEPKEYVHLPRIGVDVRIPSTSFCGRKLSYLRYDRAKNIDRRSLSISTTMITSPDRNRRHMIVSALSLRSCRASRRWPPAALRNPSFACFSAAIVPAGCVGPNNQGTYLSTEITLDARCNNARRIRKA